MGGGYLHADGKFGPSPVVLGEAITTYAAGDYPVFMYCKTGVK